MLRWASVPPPTWIRPRSCRHCAAACFLTESKPRHGGFSARRLASAFAALTYEIATLACTCWVPSANVTYAPEPLPAVGLPPAL